MEDTDFLPLFGKPVIPFSRPLSFYKYFSLYKILYLCLVSTDLFFSVFYICRKPPLFHTGCPRCEGLVGPCRRPPWQPAFYLPHPDSCSSGGAFCATPFLRLEKRNRGGSSTLSYLPSCASTKGGGCLGPSCVTFCLFLFIFMIIDIFIHRHFLGGGGGLQQGGGGG